MKPHSPKMSRRKFLVTSPAVVASIANLSVVPIQPVSAQTPENSTDPEATIDSIDQIAPYGIVQSRVEGETATQLAEIPLTVAHIHYTALAMGMTTLSSTQYLSPSGYQTLSQKVNDVLGAMSEDKLTFTDYKLETQTEGVWAENNTATVIWTERVTMNLAGDPDPNAPQTSFETKTHLTMLRKDGGGWYIEKDDENFGVMPLTFDAYEKPEPVPEPPPNTEHISGQYQIFLPFITRDAEQQVLPTSPQSGDISAQATYSRESAAAYALKYGNASDGSGSGKTGYHDFGNNCTNFISQCLKAGGWPQKSGYYKSTDGWWYNGMWPTYAAYPWHNSHYWYWFTTNTKRGSLISSIWDLWFGDILQYDWQKDGYLDHSAFVRYRSTSGVIYMAQHTNNYSSKPLSQIYGTYKNTCWYFPWRMKTQF